MVVFNIHLIALSSGTTIPTFLSKLYDHRPNIKPIFQAQVLRWMILPTRISAGHLLNRNIHWDLLVALDATDAIPAALQKPDIIAALWTVSCGVSARTLAGYAKSNAELLKPTTITTAVSLPEISDSTDSQNLEYSRELSEWISALPRATASHPVSMLNLLAFHEGKKDQYVQYGREFSARVGAKHGGHVKIAARVVDGGEEGRRARDDGWEEIAFVHYPSVKHFAAMSASEDYQEVNRKYRLGALKDTFILCVVEVDDHGELLGARVGREKL